MRPLPAEHVQTAVEVTGRFPRVHGAPVHVGSAKGAAATSAPAMRAARSSTRDSGTRGTFLWPTRGTPAAPDTWHSRGARHVSLPRRPTRGTPAAPDTWHSRGADLGIADVGTPDYGDAVSVRDGEVTCFWACGVTPQQARHRQHHRIPV